MKNIIKKLCMTVLIMAMLLPSEAVAAGQDAVTLIQEEDKAALLLEMSNADEERITAVSVALKVDVDAGNRDSVSVSFEFAPDLSGGDLSGTEKGFLYDSSTGILNIYAASSQRLFQEEALKLGYVRVQPEDPSQVVSVEISYHEASFKTANGSYGSKIPMVSGNTEPLDMQVGQGNYDGGTDDPGQTAPDTGDHGQGNQTGAESGGSQQGAGAGVDNAGGNINQGLYDDSTGYVHDPSSAQSISSSVIGGKEKDAGLMDLSQGTAAQVGGRPSGTGSGDSPVRARVSVVAPGDGPASISVASGDSSHGSGGDASGREDIGGALAGEDAAGQERSGTGDSQEGLQDKILLDQENGGVQSDAGKKGYVPVLIAGGAIAAAGGIGVAGFLIAGRKGSGNAGAAPGRKKKKPVRRKRPAGKRTNDARTAGKQAGKSGRKSPANKKKPAR